MDKQTSTSSIHETETNSSEGMKMTIENYSGCDKAIREALSALLQQITVLARQDMYAERQHKLDRKTSQKSWQYFPQRVPLANEDIIAHLSSDGPHLGIYPMEAGSDTTQLAVLDLDDHGSFLDWEAMASIASRVSNILGNYGMRPLRLRSGGGSGIHLWLAWEQPQPAARARNFLRSVIHQAGYMDGTSGVLEGHIEVFPKQDALADKGGGSTGSPIALPFGRQSVLLDEGMLPVGADVAVATMLPYSPAVPQMETPGKVEQEIEHSDAHTSADLATVKEALQHVDADDRATWIRMMYALRSAFPGDDGLEVFKEYSSRSDKYDERECEKFWAKDAPARRISLGSLFFAARKGGWQGKLKPVDFFESNGAIYWRKRLKDGSAVPIQLCNISVKIVEDVTYDDGSGKLLRFFIVEHNGKRVEVPAKSFRDMEWLLDTLGAKAIIRTEAQKQKLAEAIQELSGDVPQRTIYTHTGYRSVDATLVYLHAGGAIGEHGAADSVESKPEGSLAKFILLPPSDPKAAVTASLQLLELAPPHIAYALLAAVFRAPLGEFLPLDFSLFLAGDTGTFKSAVSGVLQAHWGVEWAGGRRFPGSWAATPNSLEKMAFLAKDAVMVVDDFAPTGSAHDVQQMHKNADRLLRAAGNRTGRSRLHADISLRPETYPRGLIVGSGEDIPGGTSLRARMVVLELVKGDIKKDVLSTLQNAAHTGLLAQCMYGYVQYIAGKGAGFSDALLQKKNAMRDEMQVAHARTPDNISSLLLGLEQFLAYAATVGALDAEAAKKHMEQAKQALQEYAAAAEQHLRDEDSVTRFFDCVKGAIFSGRAHLCDMDGEQPSWPNSLGWRARDFYTTEGEPKREFHPSGEKIGAVNGNDLYLLLGPAYSVAERYAREHGKSLGVKPNTLAKRIKERGLLLTCEKGRNLSRSMINGQRAWVMHVSLPRVLGITTLNTQDAKQLAEVE